MQPNVVVIVVDTLRADHLSQYGYERATSPALDAFRNQATLFTNAFTPANWTTPSVASLLTGLSPSRHRVARTGDRLPDDAKTIAQYLRQEGYFTYGDSANINVATELGFNRGFDAWNQPPSDDGVLAYPDIEVMVESFSSGLQSMTADRPFVAYIHPMNVHGPYRVPKGRRSALLGHPPDQAFAYYGKVMGSVLGGRLADRKRVSRQMVESLVDQYDTAVRYTTDEIARLLELLEASGDYDDSLIVITSDHGEELFDHGGFSHGYTVYEEILQVPLLIKLPGQQTATTVDETVLLQDVLPTILELIGLEVPPGLDGKSLAQLLLPDDDGSASTQWTGSPRLHHGTARKRCDCRALVVGDEKLIVTASSYQHDGAAVELFDLSKDPKERSDIAMVDRERTQTMIGRFEEAFARAMEDPLDRGENVLDSMDQERLEALGYLDSADSD